MAFFDKKEKRGGQGCDERLKCALENQGGTGRGMAKAEYFLHGDFDTVLATLEAAVFKSASASLEDSSDFRAPSCRVAVRVYERYSWTGGNRVSLNITLTESDGQLFCSAISSGGSQAMFFKINTFGEEAFLDCVREALEAFSAENGKQ